jgi:7-keto-8-aminopelargonate synthetase-like enzyme
MGTYSKALGGFGAYVAGSGTLVDYLVNAARGFIYSTALPPSVAASNLAAVKLCLDGMERGRELLSRAERFRHRLRETGWRPEGSSQIVPVTVSDSKAALEVGRKLRERGFLAVPIRPPTVPESEARLRFSLCWAHPQKDLERLTEALNDLG